MLYIKIKILFFTLGLVFILNAQVVAEEKPAESSEAPSGDQADREWAKRTSKLNIHESKIKDLTKKLQAMIQNKNSNSKMIDEKGQPVDLISQIAASHKELKDTVGMYNKEKDELKYRYPEEGQLIERRYVPLRPQSLEQIEKEIGIDAELSKTKIKIDKKYATFVGDTVVPPPKIEKPESTLKETKPNPQAPERLKLKK